METRRDIAYDKTRPLLAYLAAQGGTWTEWDREKGRLVGMCQGQPVALRLPVMLPLPSESITLPDYLAAMPALPPSYLLILIQAGHSAFAYFQDGELLHHKVIKKYMVRGNGRAQVGYLQTRGKSKAGSRVRLANTVTFFEDINEKLREWEVAEAATRILVSCGEKLRPLWFGSRITPPFAKDDARLIKVPFDVQRPDFEELKAMHKQLQRARYEGPTALVDAFFAES